MLATTKKAEARFLALRRELDAVAQSKQPIKAKQIFQRCFRQQRDLIRDPARRKAARCAGRAGKTFTAIAYLITAALETANAECLYISLSLKKAKALLWRQLRRLNKDFELGCEFNGTELRCTFPNGSRITLGGADNAAAIEKYRGEPYHLVIIDECKSFPAALLDELIVEIIVPRLNDYKGTLLLIGTPGSVLTGLFYQVTGPEATQIAEIGAARIAVSIPYDERKAERFEGVQASWSLHTWGLEDNNTTPQTRQLWKEACAEKARNAWSDDNPIWRREYKGEWCADAGKRVYAFDAARDIWEPSLRSAKNPFGLPDPAAGWEFVLGMDLGYRDAFALEVLAFNDHVQTVYHVWEVREKRMNVTAMAGAIKDVVELCGGRCAGMVSDYAGVGEAILDELGQIHGLWFDRAAKKEKRDYVELTNARLMERKLKIRKGCKLVDEMAYLVWDEKNPLKEKASLDRDCADAALYADREVQQRHRFSPPEDVPPPGSEGALQRQAESEFEAAARRRKRERKGDVFDQPVTDGRSDQIEAPGWEWDR